ncbi:hypothetical protein GSI_08594 [Ganoderma sinense ZZ0214-1]|uniref:Uncharacterized protein n=1 Tax=Ganoderma sinense ZZ0214-1 TaxID=1077348 RepID=A0A2G8S441_9APHY|nr:hypothetical protein GSI_08594 [Ganoderma sinense ZZ0214-1]
MFSWTGGIAPFSLFIVDYEGETAIQEFDSIEDGIFVWNPPQRVVGRVLYAAVIDEDGTGDEDDTDNFVVQSATCSSSISSALPTFPTTSVSPTTNSASARIPNTPQPTPPQDPTIRPSDPTLSSSSTPATTTLPRSSPSSPSQSLSITSSVSPQPSSNNNNNNSTSTFPTTGTPSSTDGSTSSPTSSFTTPAQQSTPSRPHRKPTTSAGEIAGIVLGAVAILAMLVGLVTWWWLVRRRTRDRALAREPEDDKYTALNSSRSTQHEHEPSLSRPRSAGSKAAIRRHAYSGASPTTTAAPTSLLHGGVDGAVEWDVDGEGGEVLHLHAGRAAANSLSVEPPTPQPFQFGFDFGFDQRRGRAPSQPGVLRPLSVPPIPRPMVKTKTKTNGGEVGARGGGRTTAVAADSLAGAGVDPEPEARRGVQLGAGTVTGLPPREVDPDVKLAEDGDRDRDRDRGVGGEVRSVVIGARTRTRLTIIESDAGVRLAGGPPGLPVAPLPLDTDCAAITMLPPPYRHYDTNSSSVS